MAPAFLNKNMEIMYNGQVFKGCWLPIPSGGSQPCILATMDQISGGAAMKPWLSRINPADPDASYLQIPSEIWKNDFPYVQVRDYLGTPHLAEVFQGEEGAYWFKLCQNPYKDFYYFPSPKGGPLR